VLQRPSGTPICWNIATLVFVGCPFEFQIILSGKPQFLSRTLPPEKVRKLKTRASACQPLVRPTIRGVLSWLGGGKALRPFFLPTKNRQGSGPFIIGFLNFGPFLATTRAYTGLSLVSRLITSWNRSARRDWSIRFNWSDFAGAGGLAVIIEEIRASPRGGRPRLESP